MKRRVYGIILLFTTIITAFFTLPVDVYAIQNESNQLTNQDVTEYFGPTYNFDADTLEELSNDADIDNYSIMTEIRAINDSKKLADTSISLLEPIMLTDEQVDKYFAQEYFNKETDLNEEVSEQLFIQSIFRH